MSRTSSTSSSGAEPDCESQPRPLEVVTDDPEALARIEQTLALYARLLSLLRILKNRADEAGEDPRT